MKTYNKLVRDNTLKILNEKSIKYKHHIASDEEHFIKLNEKLQEEISEFNEYPCMEEFADILEVLEAIGNYHKFDFGEIKTVKDIKQIERGAFDNKIILESTEQTEKPKQPQIRIIRDGVEAKCPNCGSSVAKSLMIFGKKYCINPSCPHYEIPITK